ncbi:hypothetical protein ABEB36_006566 [Hypothenemus hampei]|uniref:Bardet-Biedl syndrome 2 protein homolog n=1 Tax=Hypothenemus hampei TaxID=57062 RepID=A0ABD1EQY8_HYPHA
MDKHIRPVFTLELGYKILAGLVTIGKYDGTHPCLTVATSTDKVLIHNPHRKVNNSNQVGKVIWSESNRELATLNINSMVTALAAYAVLPNVSRDILIIGTATNILVYDVHDNRDLFFKECEDGVRCVTVGNGQMILVGGNSSVHGYDHLGNDVFWIAVGDCVTSLSCLPDQKLIVSSEDFYIRIFKGGDLESELNETEAVSNLLGLPNEKFAYSVSNGTIGVYEKTSRLWRVKSKNFAISMLSYDLLGRTTGPQLITGWSNGKIDCRTLTTGEVLFKDTMNSSVAGIVEADYRSCGKCDLICVSIDGEVKGYTKTKAAAEGSNGIEQDTIKHLLSQKQALLMELKHYENNVKFNSNIMNETESYEARGVIPSNTRLQIVVTTNSDIETTSEAHVEVYICTNNSTIIKAVILFAEGIFKGESHVVHPETSKLASGMSIPLYLPKDVPIDIHLKALIGYPNSVQFHVFEITKQLPTFSMYRAKQVHVKPTSWVEFQINERLQRLCMWLNQNFILSEDIELTSEDHLELSLECLRDKTVLVIRFDISGKSVIFTDNIFLAADLVQCLANYLKIEGLESKANFPKEEENLKLLMQKLSDIQEARLKLDTDVADKFGQIRNLVVAAEDFRINDLTEMLECYRELDNVNKSLINGFNIKAQNYSEGIETMKSINNIIQKASRVRVGEFSTKMIGHCRNAIKNNNIDGLIKILRTGEP